MVTFSTLIFLLREQMEGLKVTKFSTAQKLFTLSQRKGEVCRKSGSGRVMYCNWKKKYGSLIPEVLPCRLVSTNQQSITSLAAPCSSPLLKRKRRNLGARCALRLSACPRRASPRRMGYQYEENREPNCVKADNKLPGRTKSRQLISCWINWQLEGNLGY